MTTESAVNGKLHLPIHTQPYSHTPPLYAETQLQANLYGFFSYRGRCLT